MARGFNRHRKFYAQGTPFFMRYMSWVTYSCAWCVIQPDDASGPAVLAQACDGGIVFW